MTIILDASYYIGTLRHQCNTYIGVPLKCKYIKVSDIAGQTNDHIEQYSFLPIDNCFTSMSFGGC